MLLQRGYTQRINLQSLVQYILTGDEMNDPEAGPLLERDKKHEALIEDELQRLVSRGCNRWDDLSDHEKVLLCERETEKLYSVISKQARLAVEVGVLVGVRLSGQYREVDQSYPELPPEPPLDVSKWRANLNNREKEST